MQAQYDIVIAGGSMVGATLACALGGSGLRVAVLEAAPAAAPAGGHEFDLRVSAITRASQRIFQALAVWDAMTARRVSPFREMRVWDAGGSGSIHFDSAEIGEDTLGYIVENRVIQDALWRRLDDFSNVELMCPVVLDGFEHAGERVRVHLQDGRELETRLLVGADGGRSVVRARAGISVQGREYDQVAVVAVVKPERFHRETAWQRFLPTGPLAFLPLSDGYCSIVWSTTPAHAQALLELDEADFRLQLEQAIEGTLGYIESTGARAAFPLRLQYAKSYVRPRVALVGDAVHTIHPLAGQGVNLGLLDAAVLAEVLLHSAARERDIGDLTALRRYERWRKGENLAVMAVMDGFKRVFGSSLRPLRLVRNLGLGLADGAAPFKRAVIRRAMGLEGDLPQLARSGVHPAFS